MKALAIHKKESIDQGIKQNVDRKSAVMLDKANTYFNISDYVDMHMSEKKTK